MKRLPLTCFTLTIVLSVSTSSADDYKVSTLPRQISNAQEVVEIDISKLKPGQKIEFYYDGAPAWVYRRTQEELDYISKNYTASTDENLEAIVSRIKRSANSTSSYISARLQLVDQPELEKSPFRSKDHEYFVFVPLGRLGCTLTEQLPSDVNNATGAWLFDPCFNQVYDLTGQFLGQLGTLYSMDTGVLIESEREVFPRTQIPPHRYTADGTLIVGVADFSTTPDISLSEEQLYTGLTPTDVAMKASSFNDIERVKAAINEGADVTSSAGIIPDPTVSLALRRAVFFGSTELVELILSNGAVPHKIEIDWARRMKQHDISELLEAAAD